MLILTISKQPLEVNGEIIRPCNRCKYAHLKKVYQNFLSVVNKTNFTFEEKDQLQMQSNLFSETESGPSYLSQRLLGL